MYVQSEMQSFPKTKHEKLSVGMQASQTFTFCDHYTVSKNNETCVNSYFCALLTDHKH